MMVLVAIALGASGCGGKSDAPASTQSVASSSTGRTPPNSTSAASRFIAEADAICRKSNARLSGSDPKGTSPEEIAKVVVENEGIERTTAGELARLAPPAKLARTWGKMLAYRRVLASQLGDFAAAVRRGEKKFSTLAKSKKRLHAALTKTAREAGFKDCAKIGKT